MPGEREELEFKWKVPPRPAFCRLDSCSFTVTSSKAAFAAATAKAALTKTISKLAGNGTVLLNPLSNTTQQVAVLFNGTATPAASAAALCASLPADLARELSTKNFGVVAIEDAALGYSSKPASSARACTYTGACSWWWWTCHTYLNCKRNRCSYTCYCAYSSCWGK